MLMVDVMAPGAVVMVVVAVVMAMVMVVVSVVMAVAAVVVAVAQVVIAVVGYEKNEYFSFIPHSNGQNRVRDSYKAPIASYESLEFF